MPNLRDRSISIVTENQSDNGAYVACPNFEQYKYCWLRDGAFIAYAMDRCGEHDSSRRFHEWVGRVILSQADRVTAIVRSIRGGRTPGPREMLPTRYRLDGTRSDDDWANFQLDGYGTWIWGLAEHVRMTGDSGFLDEASEPVSITVDYLTHCWMMPNYDCWEEFGDRVHPSTLACIFGGLTSINRYLERDDIAATAAAIRQFVLDTSISSGRFIKSVGNNSIDASLLWLSVPFAVVDPADPAMEATVREVERKLHHSGVHRYPEDTYYGGGEWPLLACWLGWYRCRAGEPDRARPILEWVESCANESGELPEQISTHTNAPEYYLPWRERWGEVATPLLWSHAMYLVLNSELSSR
ncbi:MAG: glycoside hydrolase family 15 protein [Firmicutes bacterium]|nr:glycoside hydrolase family 15 protein [Bacillota bacterium]